MERIKIKTFSSEAMKLYLKQHFLLREKVNTSDENHSRNLHFQTLEIFSRLHKLLSIENPHVKMVVGLGGDFKSGKEQYLLKYSAFCRRKEMFEFPNNLVSFIPPNFENFLDFARYANTVRKDIM